MARKRFYVVIHGRQPGIYQEWSGEEGAAEQVEGVDEAIFKGFETIEEAVEWIRGFDRETLLRLAPDLLDLVDRRSSGQQAKSPEDWLRAGSVVIYTHGAVIAHPDLGGYGVVLCFGNHRKELSGGLSRTSDRRMELIACIEGLRTLRFTCWVVLYSDSSYVVHGLTRGWAERWQAEGWKLGDNQEVMNADLWRRLVTLCHIHHVRFRSVGGLASHHDYSRCTELATAAAKHPNLPADLSREDGMPDIGRAL